MSCCTSTCTPWQEVCIYTSGCFPPIGHTVCWLPEPLPCQTEHKYKSHQIRLNQYLLETPPRMVWQDGSKRSCAGLTVHLQGNRKVRWRLHTGTQTSKGYRRHLGCLPTCVGMSLPVSYATSTEAASTESSAHTSHPMARRSLKRWSQPVCSREERKLEELWGGGGGGGKGGGRR